MNLVLRVLVVVGPEVVVVDVVAVACVVEDVVVLVLGVARGCLFIFCLGTSLRLIEFVELMLGWIVVVGRLATIFLPALLASLGTVPVGSPGAFSVLPSTGGGSYSEVAGRAVAGIPLVVGTVVPAVPAVSSGCTAVVAEAADRTGLLAAVVAVVVVGIVAVVVLKIAAAAESQTAAAVAEEIAAVTAAAGKETAAEQEVVVVFDQIVAAAEIVVDSVAEKALGCVVVKKL